MSYKSILTYFDGYKHSKGQLAAAIDLARRFDAKLSVIVFAYNITMPTYELGEAATSNLADIFRHAQTRAEDHAQEAEQRIRSAGVRGETHTFVCVHSDVGDELGRRARFADLVVLGPAYADLHPNTAGATLEGALFVGDAPVLVCPENAVTATTESIVIAWNGSREAHRAVRAAIPFLQTASSVEIAVIDLSLAERASADNLVEMLSCQGIAANVVSDAGNFRTVEEAIRHHADNLGAGLIVMGAYSHSWFREYIIGGVTREIVSDPPVPVLFAH